MYSDLPVRRLYRQLRLVYGPPRNKRPEHEFNPQYGNHYAFVPCSMLCSGEMSVYLTQGRFSLLAMESSLNWVIDGPCDVTSLAGMDCGATSRPLPDRRVDVSLP